MLLLLQLRQKMLAGIIFMYILAHKGGGHLSFCSLKPFIQFESLFRWKLTFYYFCRYKIYDIKPKTVSDADFLHQISVQNGYDGLHISRVLDKPAKIMVAPEQQKEFERLLNERGMKFEITVDNVSKHFGQNNRSKQAPLPRSGRISFDRYYRHDAINSYLQEVAAKYPKYAKVETVGKSYEGREMKTIRISNGDGNSNKKVIFVDAGIHAREWVAPAAALYIIDQLLENMDENKNLLTNFDWLILPSVNPDGYDYTSTHTRMWRKTRSKGLLCYGADANRNFGFHWGVVGASNSGCDDTYRGRSAFSEIESQVVRDIMLSLKGRGKFYLTLHSYGNYILYPWGWTRYDILISG